MSKWSRVGGFCLTFVSIAGAVGAADRVPPPPRITITVPKPPVVNRPNLPSTRVPIKPPTGADTGRGSAAGQNPARRRDAVPLPGDRALATPVRASPKGPEAGPQKPAPGTALAVSGGGGLDRAAGSGGGGLSSLPSGGGGGLDTQVVVRTGQ